MKKTTILIISLTVIVVGLLSGCTGLNRAVNDSANCCIAGIICIVLFIILIAYLLGHKGTKVETILQAPPIQVQKVYVKTCPECGVENEVDSQFCKQCGTKL